MSDIYNVYNKEMANKCINFVNKMIKNCTYDNFKDDYVNIMKNLRIFYKILFNEKFDISVSSYEIVDNSKLILGNIINIFKSIINSRKVLMMSSYDATLANNINTVYEIINNINLNDLEYEKYVNEISLKIICLIDKIVERIINHGNDYNDRSEYDYYTINNMCNTLINSFIDERIKERYNL